VFNLVHNHNVIKLYFTAYESSMKTSHHDKVCELLW